MVKNRPKWWLPVTERILGGIISAEGIGLNDHRPVLPNNFLITLSKSCLKVTDLNYVYLWIKLLSL